MKNLLLVIIVFLSLASCGKKGDPEYKVLNKEIKIPTIIINKTSWIT